MASFCPAVAHAMAASGVLMPRVTACNAWLRFRVLSSATESSSLEGVWQSRVQGTNVCCVHSAICSSVLLLQRQLLLLSVVFTNHRTLLCLKRDTCIYIEPCVWGLQIALECGSVNGWPCVEMLLLYLLDVNLVILT